MNDAIHPLPKFESIVVESPVTFDAVIRRPTANPEGLVIFLHGFSLTGKKMDQALAESVPKNWISFAPNALYPISLPTEKPGLKLGYSWYVYDSHVDDYIIDPKYAVVALERAIQELGWNELPKVIVGFSQGGYLAPFLGQKLKNVLRVVGIGCGYLPDELDPAISLEVHALHGEKDEVIQLKDAESAHKKLVGLLGFSGTFRTLPDVTHRLDSRLLPPLKLLIGKNGSS